MKTDILRVAGSAYTLSHGDAHRSQQQNGGHHGHKPQPAIHTEHGQPHQQNRAEEQQEVGRENAVARWRAELDGPDLFHGDHQRNEDDVDQRPRPEVLG